jgi:PII-like signaling protein
VRAEHLKLTTYFGERDRVGGRLLGEELLDLYARQAIELSVLLRGAEGFGGLRHMRTDRLLTLSEDSPVVSVAVGERERIERLAEFVRAVQPRGLVTLEPVRMLERGIAPSGDCKLTVYLGRRESARGGPPFVAVTELLHRHGLAGATVLLGVDGSRRGIRLRARFLAHNKAVPLMVVAVGPGERLAGVFGALKTLLAAPFATVEPVNICKRDGRLLARPEPGAWQQLSVHCSQAATVNGRSLSGEIVRALLAEGGAGATSLRGIWGFHGSEHEPHGDRLLQLRRRVPVLTVALDEPQRIPRAFEIIDALTVNEGLVTAESIPDPTVHFRPALPPA